MKEKLLLITFSIYCLAASKSLFCQQFTLLRDINPGIQENQPETLTPSNGLLFFIERKTWLLGYPSDAGKELWRSDGTAAGTFKLKELDWIQDLLDVNGTIYFININVGSSGSELWKSDGSVDGTVMVKSWPYRISPEITAVDGVIYLNTSNGGELWKSDGTDAGTVMVKNVNDGPINSVFRNFTNVNGTLFFSTISGSPARHILWKSDGTESGTTIVKDVFPGSDFADLSNFFNGNGTLYFMGNDGIHGKELWKSDGTESGTVMLADIELGSNSSFITSFALLNDIVYFGIVSTPPANGLWKTDGTSGNTVQVKNFGDSGSPVNLITANGKLYFTKANPGTSLLEELWTSDGTEAGTVLVKGFEPDQGVIGVNLKYLNGALYFFADDKISGFELWKSDGTPAGTIRVTDVYKGSGGCSPKELVEVNGAIFFSANNGLHGREIWKSNGTSAGTIMLMDISFPTPGSDPKALALINGTVYFQAEDPYASPGTSRGTELFKTDGTLSGTNMIIDINRMGGSYPTQFTNLNNTSYFSANNSDFGAELWKTDGTRGGTEQVKDINPDRTFAGVGSDPANLTVSNNQLFFSANDGTNGTELWKSDGTETGTVLVRNINPASGSNPSSFLNVNGTLFFTADDGTNGNELWKSDGTETGTTMVKNINAGSAGSNISSMTVINGMLYFAANDGINGKELWKSDGTDAGTVMVKNINPGNADSDPSFLTNVSGTLYFSASDGANGNELWKSDGSGAGTVLMHDIRTGPEGSNPANLINLNGTLYFSANDGVSGMELWKSNGNTILVKDINPGAAGSDPAVLTRIGNNILFAANDGTTGNEIWLTNGTEAGTRLMQDIEPGAPGSDPTEFIEVNGKVLVSVFTSYWGREAWVADVPAESPLPLQLLEFKGAIVNNDGVLKWKTDNEYNTSSFVVERSMDGRTYSAIGSISSANTAGIHYYEYTDRDILLVGSPILYYRLKQVDINGHYEYSIIVALAITGNRNFIVLYPNPVRNQVNLAISLAQPGKLNWKVTDSHGRLVMSGVYQLAAGSTAVSIDASKWMKGMYVLQVKGTNLNEAVKLLKQ